MENLQRVVSMAGSWVREVKCSCFKASIRGTKLINPGDQSGNGVIIVARKVTPTGSSRALRPVAFPFHVMEFPQDSVHLDSLNLGQGPSGEPRQDAGSQ